MTDYEAVGNEIVRRIEALLPDHPELLTFTTAWELVDIGLEVDDLRPSGFQINAAFNAVKAAFNNSLQPEPKSGPMSEAG